MSNSQDLTNTPSEVNQTDAQSGLRSSGIELDYSNLSLSGATTVRPGVNDDYGTAAGEASGGMKDVPQNNDRLKKNTRIFYTSKFPGVILNNVTFKGENVFMIKLDPFVNKDNIFVAYRPEIELDSPKTMSDSPSESNIQRQFAKLDVGGGSRDSRKNNDRLKKNTRIFYTSKFPGVILDNKIPFKGENVFLIKLDPFVNKDNIFLAYRSEIELDSPKTMSDKVHVRSNSLFAQSK